MAWPPFTKIGQKEQLAKVYLDLGRVPIKNQGYSRAVKVFRQETTDQINLHKDYEPLQVAMKVLGTQEIRMIVQKQTKTATHVGYCYNYQGYDYEEYVMTGNQDYSQAMEDFTQRLNIKKIIKLPSRG